MKARVLFLVCLITAVGSVKAKPARSATPTHHELRVAIQHDRDVVQRIDALRRLEATALFRLGECYRKLGETNQAIAQYQRVLRDFSDQATLARVSRRQLAALLFDLVSPGDETLLEVAAAKGRIEVARFLLAHGADVNGRATAGAGTHLTPLHFAAGNGQDAMVVWLLEHGARVDAGYAIGVTPLLLAAANGHAAVAGTLVAAGATLTTRVSGNHSNEWVKLPDLHCAIRSGDSPLLAATRGGFKSIVDLCLQASQAGNALSVREKQEALNEAARSGRIEIAAALVAAGADVNGTVVDHGRRLRPLLAAAVRRQTDMVQWLLEHGANPLAKGFGSAGKRGLANVTALTLAAFLGDTRTVKVLLTHLGSTNAKTALNRPFLMALYNSHDSLAMLLARHVADLNAVQPLYGTPLIAAIRLRQQSVVNALLRLGADPNAPDVQGRRPLHWALARHNPALVEQLLAAGAKIDLADKQGITPFEFLLSQSAYDPRLSPPPLPNSIGVSLPVLLHPMQIARQAAPKFRRLIELFEQHGADPFAWRRQRILVGRGDYQIVVFHRDSAHLNRFSLLDLLAYLYADEPPTNYSRVYVPASNATRPPNRQWRLVPQLPSSRHLIFPDLARVRISRIEGKTEHTLIVDAAAMLRRKRPAPDEWLHWGDLVELPERADMRGTIWRGLSTGWGVELTTRTSRRVAIKVKRQTRTLTLTHAIWLVLPASSATVATGAVVPLSGFDTNELRAVVIRGGTGLESALIPKYGRVHPAVGTFWLSQLLHAEARLDASPPAQWVEVKRDNPSTEEHWDKQFDLSTLKAPNDLWLRNGDIITMPDKAN